MTAKELKRKLLAAGWIITEGTRHELATHPDRPGLKSSNPPAYRRHPRRNPEQHPEDNGLEMRWQE